MDTTASDSLAHHFAAWGMKRIYLSAGAADTPLGEAMRRCEALHCLLTDSGSTAAQAAVADAQLSGKIAVCCGDCGAGALSMLSAWYEAQRSATPLLALLPLPDSTLLGAEDAQNLHLETLLHDCSALYASVNTPERLLPLAAAALRTALARRSVGVLAVPSDIASSPAPEQVMPPLSLPTESAAIPDGDALLRMAELINGAARVTFLCGIGCAKAKQDLVALARRVQAPIAYTLRAKDVMEGDNPCEVGMTGLMGWGGAPVAVADCDLLVMWGTDFPFVEFLPADTPVIQVDEDAAALGRRVPLTLGVHGDVREVARALLPLIPRHRGDEHLSAARCHHRRCVAELESAVRAPDESAPLRPEYITRLVSDLAEPDAVFTTDTGAPLLWAARYLRTADTRRLLGSFRFGSPVCALAAAIGAKSTAPSRQVIALCGANSLRFDELRTLIREHLAVKILLYNHTLPTGEPPGDMAAVAQALGFATFCASSTEEASASVKPWLAATGPALLNAVTDGSICGAPPSLHLQRGTPHPLGFSLSGGLKALHRLIYGKSGQ